MVGTPEAAHDPKPARLLEACWQSFGHMTMLARLLREKGVREQLIIAAISDTLDATDLGPLLGPLHRAALANTAAIEACVAAGLSDKQMVPRSQAIVTAVGQEWSYGRPLPRRGLPRRPGT